MWWSDRPEKTHRYFQARFSLTEAGLTWEGYAQFAYLLATLRGGSRWGGWFCRTTAGESPSRRLPRRQGGCQDGPRGPWW
jgi:hypothetical protein